MRRREIIGVLGSVAAWSVAARAQQRATPVIGLLSGASLQTMRQWVAAFHLGLADAGITEDRKGLIEYRWAEGNTDRLPGLAMDLVRRAFFQGLQNLGYVDGRPIDIRSLSAAN